MNNDFPRGAGVSRPYEKNSYFLHKNCSLEEVYSICEVFTRKGNPKSFFTKQQNYAKIKP